MAQRHGYNKWFNRHKKDECPPEKLYNEGDKASVDHGGSTSTVNLIAKVIKITPYIS